MSMDAAVVRRPRTSREPVSSPGSTNLADLLERVLDKGVVIAGEIVISLGAVELLTLKIRLLIASIDKAREIGIDWWETDPFLSSQAGERHLEGDRDLLKKRLDHLERLLLPPPQEADQEHAAGGQRSSAAPAYVLDKEGRVIAELKQPVEQPHEDEGSQVPEPEAAQNAALAYVLDKQGKVIAESKQVVQQPHEDEGSQIQARVPQPEAAQAEQSAGAGPLLDQALHEHLAQAMRPVLEELRQRNAQARPRGGKKQPI